MGSILSTLDEGKFIVKEESGMKGLFAHCSFAANAVLFEVEGEELEKPTRTSVQIGTHLHVDVDAPAKYINHSCFPNIRLEGRKFIAKKHIAAGEEIQFDYNQNEESLSNPFPCRECGQWIKGKNYLAKYPCGRKN